MTEMDTQKRLDLLRSAIELELNISNLYLLYHRLYAEDAGFWWQMALEEKNHAALLKSAEHYINLGRFPEEMLYKQLDTIKAYNEDILKQIDEFEAASPPIETAYRYALKLEGSAAEFHFHKTMSTESDSAVIKIFQQLCGNDKEHLRRIQALMRKKGLLK